MSTSSQTTSKKTGCVIVSDFLVALASLAELLQDAQKKYTYPYLISQSLTDYQVTVCPKQVDPNGLQEGRLFGPDAELHWKQESNLQAGWHVVYIGLEESCPQQLIANAYSLGGFDLEEVQLLQRGENNPGQAAWYDLRIPKQLFYPAQGRTVHLTVRVFKKQGRVQFIQLTGFGKGN